MMDFRTGTERRWEYVRFELNLALLLPHARPLLGLELDLLVAHRELRGSKSWQTHAGEQTIAGQVIHSRNLSEAIAGVTA